MLEYFKEPKDEEPDLTCIIQLCPEEFSMNAITSFKDDPTSTIRLGMLGERAGLWTIDPYFVVAPAE